MFGTFEAYESSVIGLLVVFVAKNRVVSLFAASAKVLAARSNTHMTFLGCQSITVFLR